MEFENAQNNQNKNVHINTEVNEKAWSSNLKYDVLKNKNNYKNLCSPIARDTYSLR